MKKRQEMAVAVKRWFLLMVAAALVFGVSGCAFPSQNVKDLLGAPAIGEGQGEIREALAAYLGEDPQYKYPKEGSWLSPLVMADLNGDGVEEGVVLYSVANSTGANKGRGNNVYLAVLEHKDGKWVVQSDVPGPDIEVASLQVADLLGDGTQQILVGYASSNLKSKILTLYLYSEASLKIVYQLPYSRYGLFHFSESSGTDLVVVSPEDQVAGMQLYFLPTAEGEFLAPSQPVALDPNFIGCLQIAPSMDAEGAPLLVIDGVYDKGLLASQFVYFSGEHFYTVDDSGKMRADTGRMNPLLLSQDIDGDGVVEVPRRVGNNTIPTLNGDKNLEYIEWLDFKRADFNGLEPVVEQFGLLDSDREIYIKLPEEWQGRIKVVDGSQKGEWVLQNAQTLKPLLSVKTFKPEQTAPMDGLLVPGTDNTYILPGESLTALEIQQVAVKRMG